MEKESSIEESKQSEEEEISNIEPNVIMADNQGLIEVSNEDLPVAMSMEEQDAETANQGKGGVCNAFYGFLFPKMAPIRCTTFILLSILIAIP